MVFLEKILCEDDGLLARGADGYDAERDARDLCHAREVLARVFGEALIAADAGDVRLPSLECLIDRRDLSENLEACGNALEELSLILITCADFDFVKAVEDVQTRDGHVVDPGEQPRVADDDGVEPARAARAPRDGAELMPRLAQTRADVVALLCREGAFADTRAVRLDDADDLVDFLRCDARTDGDAAGDGV